jgi:phosphoribosylanthranilate isomerase
MTKAKTAVVAIAFILIAVGIIVLVAKKRSASAETKSQQAKISATMEQVKRVNISLPERQTQAKMLVMAAMVQKKIPAAANWCETLNVDGRIWPATPTNTAFAINTNMAGRAYSRALPGDTVVFFEAASTGWNQAGGAELLTGSAEGAVVALADGRALIVSPAEAASLRWTP